MPRQRPPVAPSPHLKRADQITEPFLLVVDLEATCDDGGRLPKDEMETIEFGSVLVDAVTLDPVGEFQSFIRPVRHPRLTPFCTRLTTIQQPDVDGAPGFVEVMNELVRFLAGRRALFCSWGRYDRNQLMQDAAFHHVEMPLGLRHLNLKEAFGRHLDESAMGMGGALHRVGLPLIGTHHRGIDDARNIARLLPWSLGRAPAPARP